MYRFKSATLLGFVLACVVSCAAQGYPGPTVDPGPQPSRPAEVIYADAPSAYGFDRGPIYDQAATCVPATMVKLPASPTP